MENLKDVNLQIIEEKIDKLIEYHQKEENEKKIQKENEKKVIAFITCFWIAFVLLCLIVKLIF